MPVPVHIHQDTRTVRKMLHATWPFNGAQFKHNTQIRMGHTGGMSIREKSKMFDIYEGNWNSTRGVWNCCWEQDGGIIEHVRKIESHRIGSNRIASNRIESHRIEWNGIARRGNESSNFKFRLKCAPPRKAEKKRREKMACKEARASPC